jgi:hypothetical protein
MRRCEKPAIEATPPLSEEVTIGKIERARPQEMMKTDAISLATEGPMPHMSRTRQGQWSLLISDCDRLPSVASIVETPPVYEAISKQSFNDSTAHLPLGQ